jgi:hypothetical protein
MTMKLLGIASTLATFRWDLLYLLAQLTTDERVGVSDLAPPIETAMNVLETRRVAYEQTRAAAVIATAMVDKRDQRRDRLIIEMGGVARATGRHDYKRLFPKHSPSQTAKLGIDAQTVEVMRILGELEGFDTTHPLRTNYEARLQIAQKAFATAKTKSDETAVALSIERMQVQRCKVDLDKVRLETHGKLTALLADKNEADAFFRPTTREPEEKNDASEDVVDG